MEISCQDGQFCYWGIGSQGGTYLLKLVVDQAQEIRFGRFQNGQPIAVPPGEYLYAGSALAQKGTTSLARRLLRHASRSDSQNTQSIRQKMLVVFPKINLGPKPLYPPSGKKLRGTHLLRVTAVPGWWTAFPEQITNFLQDGLA